MPDYIHHCKNCPQEAVYSTRKADKKHESKPGGDFICNSCMSKIFNERDQQKQTGQLILFEIKN